jgi:hypothetical protein
MGKSHAGIFYLVSIPQGVVGAVVKAVLFVHEAILAGAADLEVDVYNQCSTFRRHNGYSRHTAH